MAPPLPTPAQNGRETAHCYWLGGRRSLRPPHDRLGTTRRSGFSPMALADRTPDERKRRCSMAESFPRVAIIQGWLTPNHVSPPGLPQSHHGVAPDQVGAGSWHRSRTRGAGARDTSALGLDLCHPLDFAPSGRRPRDATVSKTSTSLTVGRHFISSDDWLARPRAHSILADGGC